MRLFGLTQTLRWLGWKAPSCYISAHSCYIPATFLAWGTLSTQGIVILSGVVCRVSCVWCHKSCHRAKFKNGNRYQPTFFLKVAYYWGEVQSRKKSWKRCEKRCEIAKKGVKSLIWRNLQRKTYVNHIFSCSNYVGGLFDEKKIEKGVKKKGVQSPKKLWNR